MKLFGLVSTGVLAVSLCALPAHSQGTHGRVHGEDARGPGRADAVERRAPGPRNAAAPRRRAHAAVRLPRTFSTAQVVPEARERQNGRKREYDNVFSNIQKGISSGSVELFSRHMAPQVYVNLRGGESGYYSASQAYYLLDNYFRSRRLVNFNFTTIGESDSNPYATGSAGFNFKGSREYAQVYVSLSHAGGRWVITQINIY